MTQRCKFCNEALNLDHAWTQAWVHIAGGSYLCATGNTHATPFDEADEAQAEYDKNPELQGLLTRAADSGRSTIRRRAATNSVLQERHERGFCSCAAISTEPCLLVAELDEDSAAPTLGDNIRMMRKLAGVSKPEAAEALGMDRKEFTKIEKGLRRATGAELADFAYFLDISPLAILEPDSLVGRVAASILEMRADGGREDATTARSPGTPAAALELSLDDLEWWARRDPRTGNEYDKRVRTAARAILGLDDDKDAHDDAINAQNPLHPLGRLLSVEDPVEESPEF